MLTRAELHFFEVVPNYLRDISESLKELVDLLKKVDEKN